MFYRLLLQKDFFSEAMDLVTNIFLNKYNEFHLDHYDLFVNVV